MTLWIRVGSISRRKPNTQERVDFALTRPFSICAGCLPHRTPWTTVRRRQGCTSRTRPVRIWKRSSKRYVTWKATIYSAMNPRRMCRWHWPISNSSSNNSNRRRQTRRQQSLRPPRPLPPLPPRPRRHLPRQHPRNNGYCTLSISSNFIRNSRPSSGPAWSWWSIRDPATPHVPYTERCIQNDDVLASTARNHRDLSFENEEFLSADSRGALAETGEVIAIIAIEYHVHSPFALKNSGDTLRDARRDEFYICSYYALRSPSPR